jgi:2-succinyl-6-hydroxy-2,4-cyclohexadiene-1-carboxylate synthase
MTLILALHGFTGSPRSWDFLPERAGQTRLSPALVGHAGSLASDAVTDFEGEADRLAELIASSEAAHVIGYSLGARLALSLTLRHPERVRRLTLLSGHPGLSSESQRAERRAADAAWCQLLRERGLTAFVDAWQAQPMWASQLRLDAAARDSKRAERLSHSALGLARSFRVTGLAEMPDYLPRLREVQVPVRVVAGALDHKFAALAVSMAECLPRAALELVPGVGHDLLLECPQWISQLLEREMRR